MAITTYSELKQAVTDHLDRDDLTSQVDNFIDLAEARHKREIRIREMLSRSNLAISDGDRYVDLPADFLDLKYLRILVPSTVASGRRYFPDLEQKSIHELTQVSINYERTPSSFSVHEQIEFNSECDQDYTGEIFYYTELTALSDSNATNALLDRAPDAYLYASLLASAPFLMNDERIQVWGNLYKQCRDSLNVSQQDSRRGGPLVTRVR